MRIVDSKFKHKIKFSLEFENRRKKIKKKKRKKNKSSPVAWAIFPGRPTKPNPARPTNTIVRALVSSLSRGPRTPASHSTPCALTPGSLCRVGPHPQPLGQWYSCSPSSTLAGTWGPLPSLRFSVQAPSR
jgi:hypothetical protein